MKIEVSNFGKIKKGQIDLDKKVTVFVGYNNSGKTYMSQFIWGLYSYDFFNGSKYVADNLLINDSIIITKEVIRQISTEYIDFLKKTVLPDIFNVAENYFLDDNFSIDFLNDSVAKVKKHSFKHIAVDVNDYAYGVSEYYLFYKLENSFEIMVTKKSLNRSVDISEIFREEKMENNSDYNISDYDRRLINRCPYEQAVSSIIFGSIFYWDHIPFFLPANRVFYPSYYKYIYSVAKEEKDLIDDRLKRSHNVDSIRSLSKRPYTKAMDDLIQKLYELNTNLEINTQYEDLLNDLKGLIGGDIVVKSSEGIAPIEFYLKLDNGKELEMYMSSSSANQLTSLYLYFKYWARETNNFLIIDEPEENLHPENQIKLVNILMKFADRGSNKVLITTHSPLIADHVNNYANLSYLAEAGTDTAALFTANNLDMAEVKNIKHADYGVYFFNGDSIKEYAVDDYGAYFKDFQTAEDKVKDISNLLKENIYAQKHNNGSK